MRNAHLCTIKRITVASTGQHLRVTDESRQSLDQEIVCSALLLRLDQLVTGRAAESLEIGDRAGIGRQNAQRLSGGQILQRFPRFENRQRAVQSLRVEKMFNHLKFLDD